MDDSYKEKLIEYENILKERIVKFDLDAVSKPHFQGNSVNEFTAHINYMSNLKEAEIASIRFKTTLALSVVAIIISICATIITICLNGK